MRSISTFLVFTYFIIFISAQKSEAQYSPGIPANFGIDGDNKSGSLLSGSDNPNATDDWFKKPGNGPNVGLGIIDTTGSSVNQIKISAGQNFIFNKGMAFSRYSNQNGKLFLDARYARDYFGISGDRDSTTYTNGAKNGDLPNGWSTAMGATVGNGDDIIDTYIHMRRNGTVINNTNPSPLILAMGISTVGSTGERYCDFELFRSRIEYNSNTGIFSNSGPAASGGHSAWEFNPDGSVKTIGDMSVSFAFNGSSVTQISIWIWVNKTVFLSTNPQRFDFVQGEFWGSGQNANWGYAKILKDAGISFNAWGSGANAQTAGPHWGTNSKTIGTGTNYPSSDYATGDFAEAAIDLTSLGIDPALSVGMDPCSPPFTRMMAKTRSSLSFTSALQDFVGPYEFLDAPTASAQIIPAHLKCNTTSTTLSPVTIIPGAVYNWSTSNGNIVSSPNATSITIDRVGKYYLSAAIVAGCPTTTDSVIVNGDFYQPVATAISSGSIDLNNPLSFAGIWGGDVAASNFATPFGGSAGLEWKWTGPNGYTSTARNNNVTQAGTYTLILTEQRNGCKDTAVTPITLLQVLPVKITEFSAVKKENDKVLLNWATANETPETVELMRSYNSIDYSTITYALVDVNNPNQTFSYNDNVSNRTSTRVYYKLKITEASGSVRYSWVLSLNYAANSTIKFSASPNPAINYSVLSITSDKSAIGIMQIVDINGRILLEKTIKMERGNNQVMVNEVEKLNKGMYIIRLMTDGETLSQKLIKSE